MTKPDGTVEEWAVEGGAPSALLRRGWTRDTLPPGTKVTVQGFMSKDGALRANARDITFPDGKQMFIGSSGIGAPDERQAVTSDLTPRSNETGTGFVLGR